jgi:hypothetical protein
MKKKMENEALKIVISVSFAAGLRSFTKKKQKGTSKST